MNKIAYRSIRFRTSTLAIIRDAERIINEYAAQGFTLTLRGLYYKFIGRDLFPDTWIDVEYNRRHGLPLDTKNTEKNYERLGSIITDARYGGLISWNSINDVTRAVRRNAHWTSPTDILSSAAEQFQIDKWEGQSHYVEVWIEKDAAVGMISGACEEMDVPYLSCRGYTSASEMWTAAQRLVGMYEEGRQCRILHIGDHDPSGLDMSRDIEERINEFFYHSTGGTIEFRRLALNMSQVEEYDPPPNPAKLSDSRCRAYIAEYGHHSWELDALEPDVMIRLIQESVEEVLDYRLFAELQEKEREMRELLRKAALNWSSVVVPALERGVMPSLEAASKAPRKDRRRSKK